WETCPGTSARIRKLYLFGGWCGKACSQSQLKTHPAARAAVQEKEQHARHQEKTTNEETHRRRIENGRDEPADVAAGISNSTSGHYAGAHLALPGSCAQTARQPHRRPPGLRSSCPGGHYD